MRARICDDVEFSAEDATRSDLAFLCEIAEAAVNAGATTINLPDTVGYALPADIERMFTTVGARIGDRAVLSAHCHNDLGLAVANSLAAVQAGARQVECTINGIGERAGNASLEEIVMALEVRADALPHRTGHPDPGARADQQHAVVDRRRVGSAQQGDRRRQRVRA